MRGFVEGAMLALCFAFLARAADPAPCTCAAAERSGGWSDACGAGYVGSVRVTSRMLYDEIDAHGHGFDPAKLDCDACRRAIAADGYCEHHRRGFVAGRAYVTFLAYRLAKDPHVEPQLLDCPVCRKNAESYGWCPACGRGMIGHVAVNEHELYERLLPDYRILLAANERAATCESCAAAMVLDGSCPRCRLAYRGGKPEPIAPVTDRSR